jgi:hypothetical protein
MLLMEIQQDMMKEHLWLDEKHLRLMRNPCSMMRLTAILLSLASDCWHRTIGPMSATNNTASSVMQDRRSSGRDIIDWTMCHTL